MGLSIVAARAALAAAAVLACGGAGGDAGAQAAAQAGGGSFAAGGSIEARPFATYAGPADLSGPLALGSSASLGLELRVRGGGGEALRASAEASGELSALSGAAAAAAWTALALGASPTDLLTAPAFPFYQSARAEVAASPPVTLAALRLRTLWAKLDSGWASLQMGRQVTSYGRGAFWSPVDIFTSLDASGISPVKRGADSLRARFPIGATGAFDLVALPRAKAPDSSYSARAAGLVAGVDCALLAARDGSGRRWMIGADLKPDLGLGLYAEALYSLPDSGAAGTLQAAAGADYALGDLYFTAEYYYSEAGEADPYKAGSHNVYLAATWRLSEFLGLSAFGLWDFERGRGSGTFILSWEAAQSASVSLYARAGGTGSAAKPLAAESGSYLTYKF